MNRKQMLRMLMMEELMEVAQNISKCIRFTDDHAHYEHSNIERVRAELIDFFTLVEMIEREEGIVFMPNSNTEEYRKMSLDKKYRVEKYLSISKEMGVLKEN